MEEVSYEELIQAFINAETDKDGSSWKQAAIAFYLKERMAVQAKTVSSDVGKSPRYVNQLVKTFSAFPEEGDRALDLSFSHHLKAAETDDPAYWIAQAADNHWSVRELQRAINGEEPQLDELAIAKKLWEKVVDTLEKGGEAADYIVHEIIMTVEREYTGGSSANPEVWQ